MNIRLKLIIVVGLIVEFKSDEFNLILNKYNDLNNRKSVVKFFNELTELIKEKYNE